jgi:hypothetical protein
MKYAVRTFFRFLGALLVWPLFLIGGPVWLIFLAIMWAYYWANKNSDGMWYLRRDLESIKSMLAFWRD